MEARIRSLEPSTPGPVIAAIPRGPSVRLDGERILVDRLVVSDPALAASLAERDEADRVAVVERALRIGLLALQQAATAVDVSVVQREFEKLVRQTSELNEHAARAVEDVLRTNFADGDGRLPRTLERFLGDRGALQKFVGDLFDETKRDSALGRIGGLLGQYFDGDRSKLAVLLDPTRLNSPLYQFRTEMTEGFKGIHERLATIEAAARARGEERSKSAAKGGDFEDLLEPMLGELARSCGDVLERTTSDAGAISGCKKGDFVVTLDTRLARVADARVVVEAKDRGMSVRQMRDELRVARENRGASIAVAVWTPAHAPTGVAPFTLLGDDVHVVIDPLAPDRPTLEAAVRLARLLALAKLDEREVEVDAVAIRAALAAVRQQLDGVQKMRTQLTSIGTIAKDVSASLDAMRSSILARVAEAEGELRIADSSRPAA